MISFTWIKNKRGPKTEPCGTPHFTVILFEMDVLYFTNNYF